MKLTITSFGVILALSLLGTSAHAQWDSLAFENPGNEGTRVFTASGTVFLRIYLVAPFVETSSFSRSTDDGLHWALDTNGIGSATVTSMVTSGNDIFIGAEASHTEGQNTLDSVMSLGGVFRSGDGGMTWIPKNTIPDSDGNYEVTSLAWNGSTLYRSAYGNGSPVSGSDGVGGGIGLRMTLEIAGLPL